MKTPISPGPYTHDRHHTHDRHRQVARWLALVPILLGAALATACTSTAAQQPGPGAPKVTVADVVVRDITEWDEFTGRLEAVHTVAVRPRVSGFVSAVRFVEGAMVRRGDLLFQIDPRPFQAEVDRLNAELARARAGGARATTELQRAERLSAEHAMAREEHDRRAAAAQESAAQEAAVAAALRAAQLNLEFTRVTAPISGRVGRAIVTEGNLVSTGPAEATLLTTLVSLDPIYATFDADEQVFLRSLDVARSVGGADARTRLPIRMALANEADFPHHGELNFLDNQVDATSGTIRGRAVFRNADRALTPGLFVRLQLPGGARHRGVLIQDTAVGTDLDKRFVLVVSGDRTVQYRAVTLGPLVDGLRVVRDGLGPGDRVIVNGLQRVRPGVKVDFSVVPMEESADAAAPAPASPSAARGGK
jgi:multidrug efflux system membrane fusion protein